MDEPRIGETRRIDKGSYRENQIYIECPLCHETRWTECRNGVARYPICKKHKPTPVTEQAKINNGLAQVKSWKNPERKKNQSIAQNKRFTKPEEHAKLSISRANYLQEHPEYSQEQSAKATQRYDNPEAIRVLTEARLKQWQNPNTRIKSSKTHKELWRDLNFADRMLDCIAKGNTHKQTKHEKIMESILNEYFPEQWEYTGNRKVKIGRKYPDFTHNNGSNLLIECFGDYWHGISRKDKLRYDQTVQGRIELFAQYGYKTLVLWEHEILKLPRKHIAERVQQFMENNKRDGF